MSQFRGNSSGYRGASSSVARPTTGTSLLTSNFCSRSTPSSAEHEAFRRRNNVQPNYSGPVFVTEEVYVTCSACMAPVNPVERVPVGAAWYHPQCLHCTICRKGSRTTAFYPVNGSPVCADCCSVGGGYASVPDRRSFLADHNLLQLSNGVRIDTRTTTVRQAVLMERQAVLQSHDNNFVTLSLPPIAPSSAGRRRSPSSTPPGIADRRRSTNTSKTAPLAIADSPHAAGTHKSDISDTR